MRVHVIGGVADLARDLAQIQARVRPDMRAVVRDGVKVGGTLAKTNAKRSAGKHGRWYSTAITGSMRRDMGLFGNTISGEYGPEAEMAQGDMSFEFGSRNQEPHLDLARSADVVGPSFLRSVDDAVSDWFW